MPVAAPGHQRNIGGNGEACYALAGTFLAKRRSAVVSFFRARVNVADCGRQLSLASYAPTLVLEGLVTGVDNLRHDVFLSPKLAQQARMHIARLIAKYGNVEDLVADDPL